ncbi:MULTISPECIES: hypothetical protein [Ensifer]|jgi:hypothetical protein|uniref:Uncharacterized protein n=1 Tax=Ensifer canadensis TaxID=555315 RepID=A0AAW4FLW0_9HYPH|nr:MULTISPECIES: hypothetical protein [Ensifer]AHK44785.1 hypothetical protein OV14_3458 [Ensifer adhaerens OV14]MDP9632221.1 hypothetical protein [Ensifer adhaerens]KQU74084.1 hypothetical protein ASD00_11995 [Ensifer sp. Root31]KQW58542.1 hypothetical protein ASD02_05925 [Ensifer sp. Root1252]KQW62500.1 hypothetical protein ASD03_14025 [Ensifer sp. Root127]
MADLIHPKAIEHLPMFVTPPGQSDLLFNFVVVFLLLAIFGIGTLYLRLHALPEQMAHGGSKAKFEVVAVLALIALFTHNHLFWIAGLILALVDLPDIWSPLRSIARSLEKMSGREPEPELDAHGHVRVDHPVVPEPAASAVETRVEPTSNDGRA